MNPYIKTAVAGVAGTVAMTALTMVAPMMGMPKMSPPDMLSGMMNAPVFLGWVMHFMIGVTFAFLYFFTLKKWKASSCVKGPVFGILAFVIAQVVMLMMMPMGDMAMLMGSLMGHIVYGVVAVKMIEGCGCSGSCSVS